MTGEGIPAVVGAATAFEAEGARVGIVSCRMCGAALLLDPRETFDVVQTHIDWHATANRKD